MKEPAAAPLGDAAALRRHLHGKALFVFLDYDGTLTPIVERPELAVLSPRGREALRAVAAQHPTALLSGRGREDVAALVGLPELTYAGSHGFDICGPGLAHEADPQLRSLIERLRDELEAAVGEVEGAIVESKTFSISLHYRLVAEEDRPRLEAAVDAVVAREPKLRKSSGKKVFELRSALDWDKGRALRWILEASGSDARTPLFIGDDLTDEDAFREVADKGVGVLVADRPRASAARFRLPDVDAVHELLEDLAR